MGIQMGKGKRVHQMEEITLGNGKMAENMVRELSPGQMVKSMLGNGKMEDQMVKEPTYFLMEVKGLESSEMIVLGTLLTGIKTETS